MFSDQIMPLLSTSVNNPPKIRFPAFSKWHRTRNGLRKNLLLSWRIPHALHVSLIIINSKKFWNCHPQRDDLDRVMPLNTVDLMLVRIIVVRWWWLWLCSENQWRTELLSISIDLEHDLDRRFVQWDIDNIDVGPSRGELLYHYLLGASFKPLCKVPFII